MSAIDYIPLSRQAIPLLFSNGCDSYLYICFVRKDMYSSLDLAKNIYNKLMTQQFARVNPFFISIFSQYFL